MPPTKPDKYRWLTLLSTAVAVVLGAMHLVGIESCDDYIKRAEAAEVHKRHDKRIEKLEEKHEEVISLLNQIIGKLSNE